MRIPFGIYKQIIQDNSYFNFSYQFCNLKAAIQLNFPKDFQIFICFKKHNQIFLKTQTSHSSSLLMDSNKYVLGYWGIRGRGQVLRLLLAYTGLDWEDKVYTGPEKWFGNGDKLNLGFEFPNLPYLIHKDFKLTQSYAIAKYICAVSSKKQLLGKNEEDKARVDMVLSVLQQIYNPTYALFFSPNYLTESERLFNGKIKDKLEQLKKFVGQKKYALGYLTIADFKIAQASYYFEKLYQKQYGDYTFLTKIRETIENLPQVQKYYSSENAIKSPFMPNYSQLKF